MKKEKVIEIALEPTKWQRFLHKTGLKRFDMSINVTQLESGEIEVKDSAGIRLHLLNKIDHNGLWTYFNTRLDQYSR